MTGWRAYFFQRKTSKTSARPAHFPHEALRNFPPSAPLPAPPPPTHCGRTKGKTTMATREAEDEAVRLFLSRVLLVTTRSATLEKKQHKTRCFFPPLAPGTNEQKDGNSHSSNSRATLKAKTPKALYMTGKSAVLKKNGAKTMTKSHTLPRGARFVFNNTRRQVNRLVLCAGACVCEHGSASRPIENTSEPITLSPGWHRVHSSARVRPPFPSATSKRWCPNHLQRRRTLFAFQACVINKLERLRAPLHTLPQKRSAAAHQQNKTYSYTQQVT